MTLARRALRRTGALLAPLLRALARRYPRPTALALAPVTRHLAARSGETSRLAAVRLSRLAPRELVAMPFRYRGFDMVLDLRDNAQRNVFYLGAYEEQLLAVLLRELSPGSVFVDVGAHVGIHSLPAARRVGEAGRVIAFEPAPDTADVLEQNVRSSGLGCVTVVRSALGSARTEAALRRSLSGGEHPEDLGLRSLHGEGEPVAVVDVLGFDEWAADERLDRLDVVKIDVEGNELEVLRGMRTTLGALRPRLVVVEVVPALLRRAGVGPEELERFVADAGYRADGPTIAEIARDRVGPLWPNAILRPAD